MRRKALRLYKKFKMEKFQGKYRIPSNRMADWDYSREGLYFITIVTSNRICNLGIIKDGLVILSNFGKIVQDEWLKSFEIRQELLLNQYVIMPNHLHAIVSIQDTNVETHGRASLQKTENSENQKVTFTRKPRSISSFIGGFKSNVTSKINDFIDENKMLTPKFNRHNHFFQPRYHDRIIRNDIEYHKIKDYINSNPYQWLEDTLYV